MELLNKEFPAAECSETRAEQAGGPLRPKKASAGRESVGSSVHTWLPGVCLEVITSPLKFAVC